MADRKLGKLKNIIKKQGSVVVAFSGGVDSSVLAAVSYKILGDKALAVTLDSPTMPRSELECAKKTARGIGIKHIILKHNELSNPDFKSNPKDRCYFCKDELVKVLSCVAEWEGFNSVLEGTNASELSGHRPGFRALREAGVLSPLADAAYTKEEVRLLARKFGLPNSDKPQSACLSSRIPYGEKITKRKLLKVELAEECIKSFGVKQLRVRVHKDVARVEVEPKDFEKILKNREKIAKRLKEIGFKYVTLDVLGYRSGSMNE
jgi:uncharacterized protein